MARVNNLTDFLNDVATAIKQKTGSSSPIPASQFDTEILSITTGGTYQTKSQSITTNGNYIITPDTGYDAMDRVIISVSVPSSQPVLQNKSITENGTYTADQGYDGLGEVTVNVPQTGNSVLYQSKTAMMNDSSKPVGTYGTVYEDRRTHPTVGDTLTEVFLPPIVVLSEAVTESIYYDSSSGKLMMDISPTSMYFQYMDGAMWGSTSYTSEDGITYTNSNSDGTTVKMNDFMLDNGNQYGPWNNVFSNFLVVGSMYLDGVYKYENKKDNEYVSTITAVTVDDTNKTLTTTNELVWLPQMQKMIEKLDNMNYYGLITKSGDKYYLQKTSGSIQSLRYVTSNNKLYYGSFMIYVSTPNVSPQYDLYELDLDNTNFTYIQSIDYEWNSGISSTGNRYFSTLPYNNGTVYYLLDFSKVYNMYTDNTIWSDKTGINFVCNNISYLGWHRVDSQFNISNSNELLPGKIGYGLYGTVTGDSSVYNNIDYYDMLSSKTTRIQAISAPSRQTNKSVVYNDTATSAEVLSAPAICNINTNSRKIDSERIDMIGFSTTEHYILIFNKTTNKVELYDSFFNYLFDVYNAISLDQWDYIEYCYLCENPTDSDDLVYLIIDSSISTSIYGKINVQNQTITALTYNSVKLRDLIYDGTDFYSGIQGDTTTKYGLLKNGTTVIEGDVGTSTEYMTSVCYDDTYIYLGGRYSYPNGYLIFVFNKSTGAYIGKISNSTGAYLLTLDIDTNEWYLSDLTNKRVYKLTGTTTTLLYTVSGTLGSNSDWYRLANNNSCIFSVNNVKYMFSVGRITNLSTGETTEIQYGHSQYMTSSHGTRKHFDMGFEFKSDGRIYYYTFAPKLKLVNSDNILLEQTDPVFQSSNLSLYYNVITDLDNL